MGEREEGDIRSSVLANPSSLFRESHAIILLFSRLTVIPFRSLLVRESFLMRAIISNDTD